MHSSIIIMAIIALNSVVMPVSADYELILSQKDARVATFNSNVKNTFLENEDDPDANTFTNIGDLTASDYVDDEGYYKFKLIYSNLYSQSATINNGVDNGLSVTLEWKQTSWLDETSITGYTPINVPRETIAGPGAKFLGLGKSSSVESLLDGDAQSSIYWFNAVGAIDLWYGGIPAFDRQKATAAALYVYRVTDCGCEDSINQLEADIESVKTAVRDFGSSLSAKAPSMGFIDNEPNGGDSNSWIKSRGLNVEDLSIISLLLINLIGMIYNHCRIQSKERRSFNGKKYAVQFDEETDMEPINK